MNCMDSMDSTMYGCMACMDRTVLLSCVDTYMHIICTDCIVVANSMSISLGLVSSSSVKNAGLSFVLAHFTSLSS